MLDDDAPDGPKPRAAASPRPATCGSPGCTATVPPQLGSERFCLLHFTLSVEQRCAEMRRRIVSGTASEAYFAEVRSYATAQSLTLARAATSDLHLTDQMKKRVLSTFLTLMNQREYLDEVSHTVAAEEIRPRRARA